MHEVEPDWEGDRGMWLDRWLLAGGELGQGECEQEDEDWFHQDGIERLFEGCLCIQFKGVPVRPWRNEDACVGLA